MKNSIFMMLSVITLTTLMTVQTADAQETKSPWPGVTKKVIIDNEHVNVSEVTFAPGAVADWHSHPEYTAYATTDVKMKVEIKDKVPSVVELKAGQAIWSAPVTHKTTNVGNKPFVVIVSEIK